MGLSTLFNTHVHVVGVLKLTEKERLSSEGTALLTRIIGPWVLVSDAPFCDLTNFSPEEVHMAACYEWN